VGIDQDDKRMGTFVAEPSLPTIAALPRHIASATSDNGTVCW
jgi:hypothetical protein